MGKSHYYRHLKEKWINRHRDLKHTLLTKHKDSLDWISKNVSPKQLAISSLSGLMLLSSPNISIPMPQMTASTQQSQIPVSKHAFVVSDLSSILPTEMRPLTKEEEQKVSVVLSRDFHIKAVAELDGKRLNRSYGLIGQEQHLARYPEDTIASHFDPPAGGEEEREKFTKYGMAPGLGAWGYFAPSQTQMTKQDNMREKYYLAVQTFLVPDYSQRLPEYRDFFRFRKMFVVNPQNGSAVVAVIGDVGPAEWTGKHLGGSPEVMRHLERVDGKMRGPVLYFFLDDPNDIIPLGPVELK